MRVAILAVLLLLPSVAADHPGSNQGLGAYEPTLEQLVHRLPDVQNSFTAWEAAYPDLVDRQVIGHTGILNQPLESIRITDESVAYDNATTPLGHKFRIYLDGGHHGNEFLGVDLVMYYLEEVLAEAGADPEVAHFLQTHELYATPIVNVEGNFLDTRKNANQVDVNRNYGFEWGGPGSGSLLVEPTYRGPSAFSEPEVFANAEFARSIMPDLWITMHTGIAEFYWPWGWTFDKSPDATFFESLEAPFEAATNGRVDAMMAAELYLAAGATDDWGYGQLGIPTHTFEVHEDQNVPIYGQPIKTAILEQLNGLDFMVKNTQYMGALLDLHEQNGTFHVYNAGWGRAENITVLWDGGNATIDRLEPGDMVVFDPAPSSSFTVEYRQLLIDAPEAKTRTASYVMHEPLSDGPDGVDESVPGFGLVGMLAAAVAVALAVRRK